MNTSIFSKTLISKYKEQIFSESKCKIDSITDNTNALRVLFVHDRFAPDYAGGGEYFILRLAQALQLKGVQVSVLTTGDPCITEFEGIRTQRLAVSSYRFNGVWRKVINAAQHVDVIHTFTYHGFLPARIAATILKKPLVCTILAFFDRTWHDMKVPILGLCFQFFEHFILKQRMDAKIFISDY
ncbi:MAG: glycosyltransferase [Gammaproteobacteria bacterium]